MSRRSHVLLRILTCLLCVGEISFAVTTAKVGSAAISTQLSSQPLAFTKNMGQWPDSILFRAAAGGTTMWFTKDGIYYQFGRRIAKPSTGEAALVTGPGSQQQNMPDKFSHKSDSLEMTMIKAEFVGASRATEVIGLDEQDYRCNYFIGSDHSKWCTDVPNFRSIAAKNVYPGIDLAYYGAGDMMEYDFVVAAGADYRRIRIGYDGGTPVFVSEAGEIWIRTE